MLLQLNYVESWFVTVQDLPAYSSMRISQQADVLFEQQALTGCTTGADHLAESR